MAVKEKDMSAWLSGNTAEDEKPAEQSPQPQEEKPNFNTMEERQARLTVPIPVSMHVRVKIHCARHGITQNDMVAQAVETEAEIRVRVLEANENNQASNIPSIAP